jgi:hypothetical protein
MTRIPESFPYISKIPEWQTVSLPFNRTKNIGSVNVKWYRKTGQVKLLSSVMDIIMSKNADSISVKNGVPFLSQEYTKVSANKIEAIYPE